LIKRLTLKIILKKSLFIKKISLFFPALLLTLSLTTKSFSDFEFISNYSSSSEATIHRRITALLKNYGDFITNVEYRENDTAFQINNDWIYFCNGKMLSLKNLKNEYKFSSIFYDYKSGVLTKTPAMKRKGVNPSHDFWNVLFGKTERDVRKLGQKITFLNHHAFVNNICVNPLEKIEKQIINAALTNSKVQAFIDELDIMYSFQRKKIRGVGNLSFHAYGLAVDLVPKSFNGKHVYWKWSRVYDKNWAHIPLNKRWSPPQEVINAFEQNGFIWGGKWLHFDTIHFEYRPELIDCH